MDDSTHGTGVGGWFTFARDPKTNAAAGESAHLRDEKAQGAISRDSGLDFTQASSQKKATPCQRRAHKASLGLGSGCERACLNQEILALRLGGRVLTTQTMAENMFVAQPQQRNLSGRVFEDSPSSRLRTCVRQLPTLFERSSNVRGDERHRLCFR